MSSRLDGVQAGRRLVEEDDPRAADEARREVEAPAHAAGVGLGGAVGGVGEVEPVEQLAARAACASLAARSSRRADQHRGSGGRSAARRRDAYWPVRPICSRTAAGSRSDVVPGDARGARVGLAAAWRGCARRWSCRRRWGRARRARCRADGEVDAVQRLGRPEALAQAPGFDRVFHGRQHRDGARSALAPRSHGRVSALTGPVRWRSCGALLACGCWFCRFSSWGRGRLRLP